MSDPGSAVVRFEVLGPLRAWRGDSALNLGPLQQRVVLAVLLLHANRPMGKDQLVDAVWGAAAPAYAVNLLQKHISGLRRVLEPVRSARTPSRLLTWTDAGYLLTVPAGALDLDIFDREVARARGARTAGDLPGAADALRLALGLWRGPACDGLAGPLLDAERDRLAERRIRALEERIEVDLARGEHLDLVGELRQLVAEHPLRERLHGLLMRALYQSGRQAEALAAFQEARRHLRDELGVEPTAQLRQIHQQLLTGDAALAAPAEAPRGPPAAGAELGRPSPAPAQLPHGMPDFAGREAELERLHDLVGDADAAPAAVVITAIAGTAGVGKTALAVHWAQQVRDRYPDGQLYVNLRGFDPSGSAMKPAEAIRGFLDAFAVPPQRIPLSLEAQAALYRSLLTGRRVLVVLDNARDADQVRPLLPGSPGCLVLVTSRNELTGLVAAEGAHPLAVDLLTAAEARQLLARRIGSARVAAEPEAVDDIIALCARLPLALAIVASRAATHPGFPLAALAGELREARGGLDAFDGGDPATDSRAVLSWSYQTLSGEAARVFRLLGLYPGPDIGTAAVASLAGRPAGQVRRPLAELTRAHLVTEHRPGRFTFHDLLRVYATEQAHEVDSETERRAAQHRLLDHYLHVAHAAALLLEPHRDPLALAPAQAGVGQVTLADYEQAMRWFGTEHRVLLAAIEQAAGTGFDSHAWQLAWTLGTFLHRRGLWHAWVAGERTALTAARRLADPTGLTHAYRGLARAYAWLRQYEDAHVQLRQALRLYEELDNHIGQAQVHRSLAWVLYRQGQHEREALGHAEQALTLFREAGYLAGQADALNAVGWFHALIGDHDQALAYCQQALSLHEQIGNRFGLAETLDSLGYIQHQLGALAEAAAWYRRALTLWRDLGDRYNEADTLVRLGHAHEAAGDVEAVRGCWLHAVCILDELDHPEADQIRAKLARIDELAKSPGQ